MSDQEQWNNHQPDDTSGGTRSSQETLYNPDNYDESSQVPQSSASFGQLKQECTLSVSDAEGCAAMSNIAETTVDRDVVASTSGITNMPMFAMLDPLDPDEETRMHYDNSSMIGSCVTSPGDMGMPGDVSSPFETMESDDTGMESESQILAGGKRLPPDWGMPMLSTTTPGGSSDDDPYSSNSNRKKRRKTRREMHPFYVESTKFPFQSPQSSQIPSPSPSYEAGANETEDSSAPVTSLNQRSRHSLSYSATFNNSDSSLNALMTRRCSNASESSQNTSMTRDSNAQGIDSNVAPSDQTFPVCRVQARPTSGRRRVTHHHRAANPNSAMALNVQHPSTMHGCTLTIVAQPEEQHRARYLTEGSRGPVKDSSQQGFPKLELKGYTNKTTLQVYVGVESEDKIRPHGFYQACKVTGRNTTPCDEVDINGTKVIKIPFDPKEDVSVDCVGILKLRNADVEARIGVTRAKKRNQTVKLVFRVVLEDVPNAPNPVILQVASNRISCTQPPGQPEITKKSLERCSAKGNVEMFIIGRNFHRGTKVIFQDPKEADGSHWHMVGQLDKDNFHQTHMVVMVPPYHDLNIVKPVNVQVLVEHNGKRCDPHSFTYDPIKQLRSQTNETTESEKITVKQEENPVKALLSENIDRNVLEALMKLLKPESSDVKPTVLAAQQQPQKSNEFTNDSNAHSISFPPQPTQLVQFGVEKNMLPPTIERPLATHNIPASAQFVFKPAAVLSQSTMSTKQPGAFSSVSNFQNLNCAVSQPGFLNQNSVTQSPPAFQLQGSTPNHNNCGNSQVNASMAGMMVKTESQLGAGQAMGFPSAMPGHNQGQTALNNSGTVVFSANNPQVAAVPRQTNFSLPVVQESAAVNPIQMTDVGNQQPMQSSTPVSDTSAAQPSLFPTLQTTMWPQEVLKGDPSFVFGNQITCSNSAGEAMTIISQQSGNVNTNMLPSENNAQQASAFTSTSTWVAPTQLNIATSTFNNSQGIGFMPNISLPQMPNNVISPQDNANASAPENFVWPTSAQIAFTSTQSNNSGTDQSQTVQPSLWTKQEPINPEASQEMPFNADQQLFTITESMQILDRATPVSMGVGMQQPQQNANVSQNHIVVQNTSAIIQGNGDSGEILHSPLLSGETGLSVGFDNKFTINDATVMSPNKTIESSVVPADVLQVILSDCSAVQPITSTAYNPSTQDMMANRTSEPQNSRPSETPQGIVTNGHKELTIEDLDNLIMDTNIFLVNPNEVQPPARQELNFSAPQTAQEPFPVAYSEPTQQPTVTPEATSIPQQQ